MPSNLNLGLVLTLMEARGIDSNAEMARRTGMERSYVSRLLSGKRPAHPSHVIAIAAALKVAPVLLLGTPSEADLEALAEVVAEGEAA